MARESPTRRAMRLVSGLADRQQGVVARWQLLARGISPDRIRGLVDRGFLLPAYRGVYLVGHRAPAKFTREMAAALACGPDAVVSHRSVASMLDLLPYPAGADVWITLPKGDRRSRRGIRLIRAELATDDFGRIDGVPVTAPARTILDLAAVVDDEQLERAVANGRVGRLVKESDLRVELECHPRRRGAARLRALLDRESEPAFTRSEAERLTLRLVRAADLPEPEANARIHGFEVDLLWRSERVVVEFDSLQFHAHPGAFERDRAKTNELQLRGYLVLRLTWRQITREPDLVRSRLRAALLARSVDWDVGGA